MANGDGGRTSILVFLVQLVARVVGFFGLIYFARVLPQSELGVYFLFYLVVQVSSLVSGLGLGTAIVQRVSSSDRPSAMYTAALTVIVGVSMVAAGVFVVFRGPIGAYIGVDVPLLLSLAVVGWLLADIHKRAIQGEDRVVTSNLIQLLEDGARVGVGAALISLGFGARGLMIGVIAGFVVAATAGAGLSTLGLSRPTRRDFHNLFAISRYTMFFGPTNFVYFWFDTFMIGLFLTRASVSSYEIAWQTTRVLIIPTSAIGQTIFPKVSRWESEDARSEIERILPGVVLFTLTIPLPGLVGLYVLGPEILASVYRPEYVEAAIPLVILGGYMVVESLNRVGGQILTGMDRADVPFRTRLVGITLAVALNVLLIPSYGLVGAAVATLTAKLADTLGIWIGLASVVDVELPIRSILWQAGSAVVMGFGVFVATSFIDIGSLPILFGVIIGGAVLYWVLIFLDPEIRQVLVQYLPVG